MDAPVVGAEPPRHASSPPLPPPHRCGLCDKDTVHQIAQVLLLGLATACVDSTTGDIFRTPSSVAVDTRRDLLDYLSQRADSFAAESSLVLLQGEGDEDPSSSPPPSHPSEIISDLAEDFAATRRGLLGRVSGWLLSESREDKIDDLVQDLEANGFWLPDRREAAAEPLLRGVDLRNEHHCAEGFGSEEALVEHRRRCPFHLVRCGNEGCEGSFSAVRAGRHDGECEYKVLPCEQGCGDSVVRREMDRHCITVCPMKLVNCPFYPVGCHSTVPRCRIPQHCTEEYLQFHLVYVLQKMRKMEVATDELKELASMLEKFQSENELSEALNVRSLTFALKRQEAKIEKLEAEINERRSREKELSEQGEVLLEENKPEDNQVEGQLQDNNKVEGGGDGGHSGEKNHKEAPSQEN